MTHKAPGAKSHLKLCGDIKRKVREREEILILIRYSRNIVQVAFASHMNNALKNL